MNFEIDNKEVGLRIKENREKLGMTRDEFSESVEISSVFLAQIEGGFRQMSLNTLVKIAGKLNISLDYLIYGEAPLVIDKEHLIQLINDSSKNQLKVLNGVINIILPQIKK